MELTNHICLQPTLRMCGALHCLPHKFFMAGCLSTGTSLPLNYLRFILILSSYLWSNQFPRDFFPQSFMISCFINFSYMFNSSYLLHLVYLIKDFVFRHLQFMSLPQDNYPYSTVNVYCKLEGWQLSKLNLYYLVAGH
jgi:hypothetical protein